MKREIKTLVVIGAGVMGTRLAGLFAHLGIQVYLLDRKTEAEEGEEKQGSANQIAEHAWKQALAARPSMLYLPEDAHRVHIGNLVDDLEVLSQADWIIEAVSEREDIKKQVLDLVEAHRSPQALVTSNTSGLSIHSMAEGRSASFRRHFAGMHFFNPPRYLKLVELIAGADTEEDVMAFLADFSFRFLGKTPIRCRDTPAFIANRVGVFGFLEAFRGMKTHQLSIEDVDFLTGPLVGRPKSASFRTADMVGLDTLDLVSRNLRQSLPKEAEKGYFDLPEFVEAMVRNRWWGQKTGQGFYKKQEKEGGSEIWSLRWETMDYGPLRKPDFPEVRELRKENLPQRLKSLYEAEGKAGAFWRSYIQSLLSYVSWLVPSVSDYPHLIDQALRHGFGWEMGPFEIWDAIGVEPLVLAMKKEGKDPAPWVEEMIAGGGASIYQILDKGMGSYSPKSKEVEPMEEPQGWRDLDRRKDQIIWQSSAARLYDLGEDIWLLRWDSKMNAIGAEAISAIHQAIDRAESKGCGLILANGGPNFSAGADLGLLFMLAVDQEFDELDLAVRQFQQTSLRLRYSSVPVVVAPHGLCLGGGLEFCLHADQVVAAAETYMGLVELGVGLIPAGGGTKEMALRASERRIEGDLEINDLVRYFRRIGMAEVSGSAPEALKWGYLRPGRDQVVMHEDRRISLAKWYIRAARDAGYRPQPRADRIRVQGRGALGGMISGLHGMRRARRISEYDQHLAQKLAWVICGGDLSSPQWVSESYLLDLEREAFLSLCGERKTLQRLESMIKTGKPLRN